MDSRTAMKVFCEKTGYNMPEATHRLRRMQEAGHLPTGRRGRGKASRDLVAVDCASMIIGLAGTDNGSHAAAACMSRGRLVPTFAEIIRSKSDGVETREIITGDAMPLKDKILLEVLTMIIVSLTVPELRDDPAIQINCVEFLQRLPLACIKLGMVVGADEEIVSVDQWFAPDLTVRPIAACPNDGSLFCPRFPVPRDALRVLADIAADRPDEQIAPGRVLPQKAIEALGTYGERVLH